MAEPRTYNIPLRKEFQKAPKYKRAKKAVTAVREYLVKHMRNENVLIGPKLNLKIWEHGIQNPPHHVKVTAVEDKEGVVRAELFGFKFEKKEVKEKKEKPKGIAGKLQEKLGPKEEEAPKTEATKKKDIKEVKKGVEKPAEKKEEKPAAPTPAPAAEAKPEKKKETKA
ncbi:50S ribosomal protein L31e [Candidatus Woesearchaeota archaeon]|nr:50S ribosomal protein L31e [Candidatus Woesearchaeota archaeon]